MLIVSRKRASASLVFLIALLGVLGAACGTDDAPAAGSGSASGGSARIIIDDGRSWTVDDFQVASASAAGVKTSKEYDVADLPSAVAAWKLLFDRKDFEARFYPDHATAINAGTAWADSVTGGDADEVGDNVLWEEGRNDRRQCNRKAETPHSSCSYTARYGDYVIQGNMVLLCEGPNSEEALKACNDILKVIS